MKTHAMIINYQYCTGCHACEVSCRNEKELTLDEWGIELTQHGPVQMQGEWMWDYIPVLSQACDLCEDRRSEGKVPSCQLHCLSSCIEVLPIEEVSARLGELGEKTAVYIP